jgi:hypothetical protein
MCSFYFFKEYNLKEIVMGSGADYRYCLGCRVDLLAETCKCPPSDPNRCMTAADLERIKSKTDDVKGKTVLEEAKEVVDGERQHSYGHPKDNHGCTAVLWSAYISRKYDISLQLDARDVCWLNILQKASRDANMEKRDNLLDTCGYARNAEMCE